MDIFGVFLRESGRQFPPMRIFESASWIPFHNFKLESQLFPSADRAQIELPKFSSEAKAGPVLVHVGNELNSDRSPKIWRCVSSRSKKEGGKRRPQAIRARI
jgi:hypothetical protein